MLCLSGIATWLFLVMLAEALEIHLPDPSSSNWMGTAVFAAIPFLAPILIPLGEIKPIFAAWAIAWQVLAGLILKRLSKAMRLIFLFSVK
jgi:hypothetical protein